MVNCCCIIGAVCDTLPQLRQKDVLVSRWSANSKQQNHHGTKCFRLPTRALFPVLRLDSDAIHHQVDQSVPPAAACVILLNPCSADAVLAVPIVQRLTQRHCRCVAVLLCDDPNHPPTGAAALRLYCFLRFMKALGCRLWFHYLDTSPFPK